MAEVLGTFASALTVAALFKLCIEAFETISIVQKQATDLKKLTTRLRIEKARLYIWGQGMGLTENVEPGVQRPIDRYEFPELVRDSLHLILELFKGSQKLKEKYGCATVDWSTDNGHDLEVGRSNALQHLNACFDNFKIGPTTLVKESTLKQKCSWVAYDRKKFTILIQDAKDLIDGLENITKHLSAITVQQEKVCAGISKVNNVRTLAWISEVCEVDHPAFSDAAASKADSISETSTAHRRTQEWNHSVRHAEKIETSDASTSFDSSIGDVEDMTITEAKHTLNTLSIRRKEKRRHAKRAARRDAAVDMPTASVPAAVQYLDRSVAVKNLLRSSPDNVLTVLREENLVIKVGRVRSKPTTSAEFEDELATVKEWFEDLGDGRRAAAVQIFGEVVTTSQLHSLIHTYELLLNSRLGRPVGLTRLMDNVEPTIRRKGVRRMSLPPTPAASPVSSSGATFVPDSNQLSHCLHTRECTRRSLELSGSRSNEELTTCYGS